MKHSSTSFDCAFASMFLNTEFETYRVSYYNRFMWFLCFIMLFEISVRHLNIILCAVIDASQFHMNILKVLLFKALCFVS